MANWYGSINNRMEENRQFVENIEVGTGVTEYGWSDRHPYEVVKVENQNHLWIRRLDHRHVGDGEMDNNWELISNPDHPSIEIEKHKNGKWYEVMRRPGERKRSIPMNISIGHAEYYFDYEF